ncbi:MULTISPECIES: S46 family peptidase [unclassified Apibacter]|uniref:S46 family peptidase n=1 Tax=unclassified Apibacter TaxID=2630820 RepID=UPI00135D6D09|nr:MULTISPECIES: S46 family peptidase [unclassified Apibacter]MXP05919.1 serine protease [Apibacter sp. B3546]MXP12630.1 serine protease [Apibacter sp. B3239]
MKKITLKSFLLTCFFNASSLVAQTGGGMWIPNQLNEKEMKEMGMKISSKQIFNTYNPSIKDAVAHFGGGCTSEVISPKGLLLTNHHCGYYSIQSHSTVTNDLLTHGFWASNYEEEKPNEGLKATFIVDIIDVTSQILLGISDNFTEQQRNIIIKNNINKICSTIKKEDYQNITILPFYNGNQYYAFITETYEDIRLVGAPPSSIGKYGSDTDNWMWPRHTGDFSLFRIYADKNNHPAKYSKDNIPYTPKYYLPISIKEKKENDFSFVYGFPGRTQEYLPASAIEQLLEITNPSRITLRNESLKILDHAMRENKEIKIKYAAKYASIANGWKKWIGENQGLLKSNAIEKRKEYENQLVEQSQINLDTKNKNQSLVNALNDLYKNNSRYNKAYTYFNEVFYSNSETFRMAYLVSNLLNASDQDFDKIKLRVIKNVSSIYKNYDSELDKKVSSKMLSMYSMNIEPRFQVAGHEDFEKESSCNIYLTDLWKNSYITRKKGDLISILSSDSKENIKYKLKDDAVLNFITPYIEMYRRKILPFHDDFDKKNDSLQRNYMNAQLKSFPSKKFFPDANSTLRVTYGKIDGYTPKDGVYYKPFTTLSGVIEKYIPDDYEFNLPKKLITLYKQKNFGPYSQNGDIIVNYIATNHTTGGNSGSPAFDAHGNLVGLNFDRVWEGTMSDINYDPSICRNIMVDIRYILFIIDKYAGAQRLIDEMKIVK